VVDSTGPFPKEDHGGDDVARRRAHSTTSSANRSRLTFTSFKIQLIPQDYRHWITLV